MKIKVLTVMLNNMSISHRIVFVMPALVTLLLTACDSNNFNDLQQYITSMKAKPPESIKPLPEFQRVESFVLKHEDNFRDPFKPVEKAKALEPTEQEEPDNGIHPDVNRIKEPLEAFALNSIKMVGTINMDSTLWGLIKSDGNTIYRVKVGHHLGQNDGRITLIDKKKIDLIEIVQSKPGRFIEQPATLVLAE